MKGLLLIILITAVLQFSCKKSETKATTSSSAYTPSCVSTKSFSTDVLPLINASCNISGCHNNYSNYAQINAGKVSIRSRVLNGSMPQNATFSNAQKDVIICWIDAGALNN